MTVGIDVDGRTFVFPDGWHVSKYDDWRYYREAFQRLDAKAVDLVAVDPAKTLYLIEVKDYTRPGTRMIPFNELAGAVAVKCRDTLSGLAAGRLRAADEERALARRAMEAERIRVVLHSELPSSDRPLSNPRGTLGDLRNLLRREVKAIDDKARVEDHSNSQSPWRTMLTQRC